MKKHYTICYMVTSVDGRIDCNMVGKLPGVEEYYPRLSDLKLDATLIGRMTAELEMAEKGKFAPKDDTPAGKETVSKKANHENGYDVVVDTKGTLLWKTGDSYDKPLIVLTSEQVSKEYLSYLDEQKISYIAAGTNQIDLARGVEILKDTFHVERLGIVGGPTINTAFLDAGLLDEVVILIGAGIDGRAAFPTVFQRNDNSIDVTPLKLMEVTPFDSGAVLIRYQIKPNKE